MDVFAFLPDNGAEKLRIPYLGLPADLFASQPPVSHAKIPPSFESIPQRAGFSFWEAGVGIREGHAPSFADLAKLTQTWLFFGVLFHFLPPDIKPSDFVSHDQVIADASILIPSRTRLFPNHRLRSERGFLDFATTESELLEFAALHIDGHGDISTNSWLDFASVSLSVKLLLELLREIHEPNKVRHIPASRGRNYAPAKSVIEEYKGRENPLHYRYPLPNPRAISSKTAATSLLIRNFENQGWCSQVAEVLCESLEYRSCNFLSSLLRHKAVPKRRHINCRQSRRCVAFDVNETKYPILTCPGCTCKLICASKLALATTVEAGSIPIISIAMEGNLDLIVEDLPVTSTRFNYTAISHVWSDGWGNPYTNGLRECQLLVLRQRLKEVDNSRRGGRLRFWMDTFCIPVRRTNHAIREDGQLRQKAIRHISAVFSRSTRILVLDRQLEQQLLPDQTRNQFGGSQREASASGYLLGSTWMQRGWTLDEGSLGCNACYCKFKNCYIDIRSIASDAQGHNMIPRDSAVEYCADVRKALSKSIFGVYNNPRNLKQRRRGIPHSTLRLEQFRSGWNGLAHRSVSRQEDTAIIFANLLDFNFLKLLRVPERQRLSMVVRNCKQIPLSILYSVDNPVPVVSNHAADAGQHIDWMPLNIDGTLVNRRAETREGIIELQDLVSPIAQIQCVRDRHLQFTVSSADIVALDRFSVIHGGNWMTITSLHSDYTKQSAWARAAMTESGPGLTLFVLDLDAGTDSMLGWMARGAAFFVRHKDERNNLQVEFIGSVVAQSQRQWEATTVYLPLNHKTSFMVQCNWTPTHQIKLFPRFFDHITYSHHTIHPVLLLGRRQEVQGRDREVAMLHTGGINGWVVDSLAVALRSFLDLFSVLLAIVGILAAVFDIVISSLFLYFDLHMKYWNPYCIAGWAILAILAFLWAFSSLVFHFYYKRRAAAYLASFLDEGDDQTSILAQSEGHGGHRLHDISAKQAQASMLELFDIDSMTRSSNVDETVNDHL